MTKTGSHEAARSSRSFAISSVPRAVTYVTFFPFMRYCGLFDTSYDILSNTICPELEKSRRDGNCRTDERERRGTDQ
ncbi:hypothetical protein, partial [Brucella abortus]|uniref:hypothetical protein n=1 Tax=Brucella abortus TaxID=235 RepID=UPI003D29461D